jgi:hypothetical protein
MKRRWALKQRTKSRVYLAQFEKQHDGTWAIRTTNALTIGVTTTTKLKLAGEILGVTHSIPTESILARKMASQRLDKNFLRGVGQCTSTELT